MTTAPTPQELAALGWDTVERVLIGSACLLQSINQAQGEEFPFFSAIQVRTDVSTSEQTSAQTLTFPLGVDEATELADLEALEALGWSSENLATIKEILGDATATLPTTITSIDLTKSKSIPLNTARFIGVFSFSLNNEALLESGILLENILEFNELNTGEYDGVGPATPSVINTPVLPTIPPEVVSLEQLLCWACLTLNASSSRAGEFVQISPFYATDTLSISVSLPLDWGALSATGWHLVASVPRLVSEYVAIDPSGIAGAVAGTIASPQFWLDPVDSIAQLKSLTATVGANVYVSSKQAIYGLIPALPDGVTADDDLFVELFTPSDTEVWAKGAGGSPGNGGVSSWTDLADKPDATYYRDQLASLTGGDRLDASAIKNLPADGEKGDKGDTGATPAITIGSVNQVSSSSPATVTITGTPENPVLSFEIPQGIQGIQGIQGVRGYTGGLGYSDIAVVNLNNVAAGQTVTFEIALPSSILIYKISSSSAIRLRQYLDATYRNDDLLRASTTNIQGDHGCYFDALTKVEKGFIRNFAPPAIALTTGLGYFSLTNLENTLQPLINLEITFLSLES